MDLKQRKNTAWVFLTLASVFLIIPYIRIFSYPFHSEFIEWAFCSFVAFIFSVCFIIIQPNKKLKVIWLILIITSPLVFITLGIFLSEKAEENYFNTNGQKLQALVSEVKNKKIKNFNEPKYEHFIQRDSLNKLINEDEFNDLKKKLEDFEFISYRIAEDGSVYFVLDNSDWDLNGIAYIEYDNGKWKRITGNWYKWSD